ncbi:HAD-IIA family hydrolase [Anaerococcus lactolyticus]|uniref:Acid sugar phosphatase n=1 Tax=Anaerococcus lactolyticus S7-1-13 TaxID=1284686 RepID=A0A095X6W1_9FIRM|nr:HAD-IIA family hydrolase [Anaerococcus lactolyticus]KGF05416.1 HAD family hydrolase [Anaerococcus lactolyticus S7-1-13]
MENTIDKSVFLLDMDGTIYLGNVLIDGAKEFLDKIISEGKRYIFLTNNASKDKSTYVKKLEALGIRAGKDDVFTSADASISYLSKLGKKRLFLVGNTSLRNQLLDAGFEIVDERNQDIDAVLVSFDTELNYEKLWIACDYLQDGYDYYATHPDFVCPLEGGRIMPDAGSIIELLFACVGRRPIVIGKPEDKMIEALIGAYAFKKDDLIMVGDRLYTDIAMGYKSGIKSVLVLSGETSLEDYKKSDVKADYIFSSVKDMVEKI